MGGSSSKRTFFGKKKKKKSPLDKAWRDLKGALPDKKHKKKKKKKKSKLPLNLDNLKKERKSSHSKERDKREASPLKRLSLGNPLKDGGGLGNLGKQLKRRFSLPL